MQKVGVFFDEFDNSILIFAHLEEVALFFHQFDGSAAVGAFAVNELRLGPKGFARGAIPTLVFALVNVALLVELVENLLYCLLVIFVGVNDKVILFFPTLVTFISGVGPSNIFVLHLMLDDLVNLCSPETISYVISILYSVFSSKLSIITSLSTNG